MTLCHRLYHKKATLENDRRHRPASVERPHLSSWAAGAEALEASTSVGSCGCNFDDMAPSVHHWWTLCKVDGVSSANSQRERIFVRLRCAWSRLERHDRTFDCMCTVHGSCLSAGCRARGHVYCGSPLRLSVRGRRQQVLRWHHATPCIARGTLRMAAAPSVACGRSLQLPTSPPSPPLLSSSPPSLRSASRWRP